MSETGDNAAGGLRAYPFRIRYGPGDDRLQRFYLPALERSVRYDRATGFFSSTALSVAASGIARLVRNGGRMRLLVGAALSEEDVAAVVAGRDLAAVVAARLAAGLAAVEDVLVRDRLAGLAWLAHEGRLELRVVLPVDDRGVPLPAEEAEPYFHVKFGVFHDAAGDRVAFEGSVNETAAGWSQNFEQLSVFFSWDESCRYVADIEARFERLWENRERGWRTLTLPEAVRQALLRYRPPEPPLSDPLEPVTAAVGEETEAYDAGADTRVSRAIARFLLDAPRLVGARGLGLATAPIEPWPHQRRVVERLVGSFPERFLLADEVGLGKTVEAALALRELLLHGRVQRVLLLVPAGLLRQWQEELLDKAALAVPRYEDGTLVEARGGARAVDPEALVERQPLLLVSSQLAKRRDWAERLLAAPPWDLIVVDEAHHARRNAEGRANRLLELLRGLSERTRGLWLLSATPMQLHPSELWELLSVLGLPGRWGVRPDDFVRYFEELRRWPEPDWRFLLDLVRDELAVRGCLDGDFVREAARRLGSARWQRVERALTGERFVDPRDLDSEARDVLLLALRRHTPVRRLMLRHTRSLLRRYRALGVLDQPLAEREPRVVWVELSDRERALYDRIEEYIAEFYTRLERERPGLGFVMTVYRRRLTSSFAAVRLSLQRRLEFLSRQRADVGLTEEDLGEADLDRDVSEQLAAMDWTAAEGLAEEIGYLRGFLAELDALSGDSKRERLAAVLGELFAEVETVAVFTEYYDTLVDLREALAAVYGRSVACYSGRGGELWQDGEWRPVGRAELAARFRAGQVRVLLCTDAASEGLNLQTCGALVNYDLPWNPMRVEQRIGRFDRIGQRYRRVRIVHMLYRDTVEAEIYRRLGERIAWFCDVVGELQPILSRVTVGIERLALTPRAARSSALQRVAAELEEALTRREERELLAQLLEPGEEAIERPDGVQPPLTLRDLEAALLRLPTVAGQLHPHPYRAGIYRLVSGGQVLAVTLDRRASEDSDEQPRFLTYGDELLPALVRPELGDLPAYLLRLEDERGRVGYYRLDGDRAEALLTYTDLVAATERPGTPTVEARRAAAADFAARCAAELEAAQAIEARLQAVAHSALRERARAVLYEAAAIQRLLGRGRSVRELATQGYPWAPLVRLVDGGLDDERRLEEAVNQLRQRSRKQLEGRFGYLSREANELVVRLAAALREAVPSETTVSKARDARG